MSIPRIEVGLELVDDEGDQVTVEDIDEGRGTVTLQTEDGDSYSMSIRELRSNLRDGEFASVDSDGDSDDEEE